MDLHYLEIFDTVARLQSFRRASEELHISQPALSTEVRRLEEQIGLQLFDRTGNRVRLNANGTLLHGYTARLFDLVGDMEGAMENLKTFVGGTLEIGASNTPGTYLLPGVMAAFQKEHPETRFHLSVANTAEIARMVAEGRLDLAVNGGQCRYPDSVYAEKILDDRLVLAASPRNALAGAGQVTAEMLRGVGFVVHTKNSQLYDYYLRLTEQYGLPGNIVMSLGNIDAIKNAVMTDVGVSLVPEIAVRTEVRKGRLCILPAALKGMEYPYSLIRNKNRASSATAECFVAYLRSCLE